MEQVVEEVWSDFLAGKFRKLSGERILRSVSTPTRATTLVDGKELDLLLGFGTLGANAYVLLQKFRAEHTARLARGETFEILSRAMARAGTVPFGHNTIEAARNLLMDLGFVDRVREPAFFGKMRYSAEYTLAKSIEVKRLKVETVNANGEVIEVDVLTTSRYLAKHGEAAVKAMALKARKAAPAAAEAPASPEADPAPVPEAAGATEAPTEEAAAQRPAKKSKGPTKWEEEGISRSTYYRRQRAEREAAGADPKGTPRKADRKRMSKADQARLFGHGSVSRMNQTMRRNKARMKQSNSDKGGLTE